MIGILPALAAAALLAVAPAPPIGDLPAGNPPTQPTAGARPVGNCSDYSGGTSSTEPSVAATSLRLDEAHALATGRGTRIAVIDTGVINHPRLAGRLFGGGDYILGSAGKGFDDCEGHGTAVAGLLAAAPDQADGFSGIAPEAQILSIRQSSSVYQALRDGTMQPVGNVDTLADAIVLAVRFKADVINISEAACMTEADAAANAPGLRAALRYAVSQQTVVVAAAGNVGTGNCRKEAGLVSMPGWLGEDVLTVGAVDARGEPADFTVRGPWVDVAAPGTNLQSLAVADPDKLGKDRWLTPPMWNGTSFATPWVAGTAALLRERFPQLTARQVMDRITGTARRPASTTDAAVGHGVLDPVAALTAAPIAAAGRAEPAATAPMPGLGDTPQPDPGPPPAIGIAVAAAVGMAAVATVRSLRRSRHPARPRR